MAYATEITISTGSKVSVNYQSQEVQVGVTYQLEREDQDLMQLVTSKASEVERAHRRLWKQVKAERERQVEGENDNGGHANGNGLPASNGSNGHAENGRNHESTHGHNGNGYYSEEGASANGSSGYHGSGNGRSSNLTDVQGRAIESIAKNLGMGTDELQRLMEVRCGKSHLPDLSKQQASQLIQELQRKQRSAQRQTAPSR